jgi:hypothetical protein
MSRAISATVNVASPGTASPPSYVSATDGFNFSTNAAPPVEFGKDFVQQVDEFLRRQLRGEASEVAQIGEQNRDIRE